MVRPSRAELLIAEQHGHELSDVPVLFSASCSCGWVHKATTVTLQVGRSNHIWDVVHQAKKHRAALMGGEICMPCKSSGFDPATWRACEECSGLGVILDDGDAQCAKFAIYSGHDPSEGSCICGWDGPGDWIDHARLVAQDRRSELAAFERLLHER